MKGRILIILVCAACLVPSVLFWLCLPDPLFNDPWSTVVEDRQGELLGARIADDGQWRFPYSGEVPERFSRCLVLYEDRYFYRHPGINPFSLVRAVWQDIRAGEIVSGGSTITMQVIRLSRKNRARTLPEKLVEMILALRLEIRCSKNEILALYASNAPFGGNVVGLEAASWRYYGKSPGELSWSEAAALSVLPNAPSLVYPGRNKSALRRKRDFVLDKLYSNHVVDSLTELLSKLEPLPAEPHPLPSTAPHLVDRICETHKGERVRTTINSEYQSRLNRIIALHHKRLEANEIHNLACLITSVDHGEILAYAGNIIEPEHPEYGGHVDIIPAPRSTGSILKPALYCMMLNYGEILPNTLFPDIPTHYAGYSPKNFNNRYDGAVPAKMALSRSLNIPAVRMLNAFGTERFHHLLRKLGLTTLVYPPGHYGLSLILGGAEGNLLEITGMYASFARILDHYGSTGTYSGNDLFMPSCMPGKAQIDGGSGTGRDPAVVSEPILNAASVWLTFESLIEVNRPETESGWRSFSSSSKVAWKTGTSFGFRDAWAVGVNPAFAVGVWAGNADGEGRPGLIGATAAAPVMFDVFDFLPDTTWFRSPLDEMVRVPVCKQSGHRAGLYCPDRDSVLIPLSGMNTLPCPYHTLVHLDSTERFRVNSECAGVSEIKHVPWFVLPPVEEWYYRRNHPEYKVLPPFKPGCSSGEDELEVMDLIYPKHTARIYIPFELEGHRSKVVFEAAHRDQDATIYWHLDGAYLGSTHGIHQFAMDPVKGRHELVLIDGDGHTLSRSFEIIGK